MATVKKHLSNFTFVAGMHKVKALVVCFVGSNYCGASQIIKVLMGQPLEREMEENRSYLDRYKLPHTFLRDCQETSLTLYHVATGKTSLNVSFCSTFAKWGKAAGIFVVFDVASMDSFIEAQENMREIHTSLRNVPVVLVGHRYDAAHRGLPRDLRVSKREAEEFAERYGISYIEVSELTGENMVEMLDLVAPGAILYVSSL